MTKKEEPQLKEITENEFQKLVVNSIDFCDDEIGKLCGTRQEFTRLYRNYLIDKERYNMTFYMEKDGFVSYKVNERTIGFKR